MDPSGKAIRTDYWLYKGDTFILLRSIAAIEEKNMSRISWETAPEGKNICSAVMTRSPESLSLLATCKAHGVDERWLEGILRRIPEYEHGHKNYSDLLPGNLTATYTK